MKFEIIKVDRDYNAVIESTIMEFDTEQDAHDWCRKETWSGYYYCHTAITEEK